MIKRLRGRIINIERTINRVSYVLQGIQKEDQWKYEKYPGTNGSYRTGQQYFGTTLNVRIRLFDDGQQFEFDIRDYVLQQNGNKKMSNKLLQYVIKKNLRNKVYVEESSGSYYFDNNQLDVIPLKNK